MEVVFFVVGVSKIAGYDSPSPLDGAEPPKLLGSVHETLAPFSPFLL